MSQPWRCGFAGLALLSCLLWALGAAARVPEGGSEAPAGASARPGEEASPAAALPAPPAETSGSATGAKPTSPSPPSDSTASERSKPEDACPTFSPGEPQGKRGPWVRLDPPPPYIDGTEPLLRYRRGPYSVALGGWVRYARLRRSQTARDQGSEVDAGLYAEGLVLPALGVGYRIEGHSPRVAVQGTEAREVSDLELTEASLAMQLASTPAFGAMRWGLSRVPFGLDGERLPLDRPLLRASSVEQAWAPGSGIGLLYSLDRRARWLSLLFEVGAMERGATLGAGGPASEGYGELVSSAFVRLEWAPWGQVGSLRELRLGYALLQDRDDALAMDLYLRWRRLGWLLEAEASWGGARALPWGQKAQRALELRVQWELIPEFLALNVALGDQGRAGLDQERGYVASVGFALFILRRRLALSFLLDLLDQDRDLSEDRRAAYFALDLRF